MKIKSMNEAEANLTSKQWDQVEELYYLLADVAKAANKGVQKAQKANMLKGVRSEYCNKGDVYSNLVDGFTDCFDSCDHLMYVLIRLAEDNGMVFE